MRPHIELIHEADYVWHAAELPGGEGQAGERRLSVDEEDGSSSLRLDIADGWGRSAGIHHANTEYYVLDGQLTIGGQALGPGGYVYAPKGVPTDWIRVDAGSRLLHYREYGDAGFDAVDSVDAPRWEDAREDVIVIDSAAMSWEPVAKAGPMSGLLIKYLHIDPDTGFYTRLVHAKEGWSDHRLAHHPCYEEAYTIQGRMTYNFGTLDLDTYFFRPARVKHGHFVSLEGGATWLLRSDGELVNWYTENEWVRWGGDAVNYGPNGTRMTWSQSTYDLAADTPWRDEHDRATLQSSIDYQRSLGETPPDLHLHGEGDDRSLAIVGDSDATSRWPEPRTLEHPDERSDARSHNWGAGRSWKDGEPIPAPIVSSLPVRSRSRGRWDADGM
jgi:hypothetical protein